MAVVIPVVFQNKTQIELQFINQLVVLPNQFDPEVFQKHQYPLSIRIYQIYHQPLCSRHRSAQQASNFMLSIQVSRASSLAMSACKAVFKTTVPLHVFTITRVFENRRFFIGHGTPIPKIDIALDHWPVSWTSKAYSIVWNTRPSFRCRCSILTSEKNRLRLSPTANQQQAMMWLMESMTNKAATTLLRSTQHHHKWIQKKKHVQNCWQIREQMNYIEL